MRIGLQHIFYKGLIQIILLAFLYLNPVGSLSQNVKDSIQPAKATFITSFPFTILSGGVMVIAGTLDDFTDSFHFILDTGSGGISLDSALVDYYKLPKVISQRTLRGIASIRRISYVMDRTLHLPNLDVEHLDFHLNDYELLTSTYGIRIDGIIGYSFLKQFIVKINYDRNVIEIWQQGRIKYPRNGYLLKPKINNIPVLPAIIEDGKARNGNFFFDTGAGLSFLMSEDYERDSSILKVGKKTITTQAEGLGGKKQMKLTTIKQLTIGPYTFKKVPTHIFKDDYNVTSYPDLGGLIGNDMLRRFNLILNYAENEIHMKPNSHFRENFDYSYTGLGIYLLDGQIIIEDVLPDSPGEKAGLKPGDIIIAVDNVFNGNIQNYKDVLQQIGTRVKVLVSRNGKMEMCWVKVKSFLKETY